MLEEKNYKCQDFPFLYCEPGYIVECEGCPNYKKPNIFIRFLDFLGLIVGIILFILALFRDDIDS